MEYNQQRRYRNGCSSGRQMNDTRGQNGNYSNRQMQRNRNYDGQQMRDNRGNDGRSCSSDNECGCRQERRNDGCTCQRQKGCLEESEAYPIGMGYIPWQSWSCTYDAHRGFMSGTIFPELDKPFCAAGRCRQ